MPAQLTNGAILAALVCTVLSCMQVDAALLILRGMARFESAAVTDTGA